MGAEVNGNFQFFLTDALGTVREVVDDSGNVIQSYEFNEHGIPIDGSGAMPGTFAPKTYQGALSVNDDRNDSGLYLMGHRHYAPELGRFISRDPIGFQGGLNLFNGAGANPVTMVDPSGLRPPSGILTTIMGCGAKAQQVGESVKNYKPPAPTPKPPAPNMSPAKSGQNWSTHIRRTWDWAQGIPIPTFFGPDSPEVYDMKDSPGVNKARAAYYAKNRHCVESQAWTDGGGRFGPGEFMDATEQNNATRHYIGSFNIDIYPAGNDQIRFVVTDTKSQTSLLYHAPGVYDQPAGAGYGNQTQVYTWLEPARSNF